MKSGGPRQLLALTWRWVMRTVAGYAVTVTVFTVAGSVLQPDADWSAVGGLDSLVISIVFWFVVSVPVLALAGALEAFAVWLALVVSRGSVKISAVTAGITAAAMVVALVLVYSDPRAVDLAGYALGGALIGALAARWTVVDLSRIPSLADWLTRLRGPQPLGAEGHGPGDAVRSASP